MLLPWMLMIPILTGVSCSVASDPDLSTLSGDRTELVVVANKAEAGSVELAIEYARIRNVAPSHLVFLDCDASEEIPRIPFERNILTPLVGWWNGCPPEARPHYIVTVDGVPLKIFGSGGRDAERASVDSELTLLPRIAAGEETKLPGPQRNPYFVRRRNGIYEPFDFDRHRICLVTRLTGFDSLGIDAMIQRGLHAESSFEHGRVLLDQRGGGAGTGQDWLRRAAGLVHDLGHTAQLDTLGQFVSAADSLIGYASWGSNDSSYSRDFSYEWLPGAIATTFVSSSARTFEKPPVDWIPGKAAHLDRRFGGSTQSLIGDLLESGASGASGHTYEPYLDACVRPDILFPAYLSGRTLGESFYLAMPYLSWQTVVVGDPLVRIVDPEAGADSTRSR